MDDFDFEKALQRTVTLKNAWTNNSELKYKSIKVNKVACTKNVQRKYFQNIFLKQNIHNLANCANSDLDKGKLKFYMCGTALHLNKSCRYHNTICSLCKKNEIFCEFVKIKINNSQKKWIY